jgi:hypothetical protein
VKIGLDYWQVCSHYPDYFRELARTHLAMNGEVHIISAIGKGRSGTIAAEVAELGIPNSGVHEVIFRHPRESPELKLALHVLRRDPSAGDLSAERDATPTAT